jgi:hypothetical protein
MTRPLSPKQIARAFQVPYWIAGFGPKPSVWRHPIERLRARRWLRASLKDRA